MSSGTDRKVQVGVGEVVIVGCDAWADDTGDNTADVPVLTCERSSGCNRDDGYTALIGELSFIGCSIVTGQDDGEIGTVENVASRFVDITG
ncbi:hypothetical protein CRH09_15320 [Nocardia terpenica]|uniref:Uncharacterized protein n=1 Tax=Nocardia terpenica TaxID=455432 RepID=A0A291RJU9_9NOCA|nr:hypothetical protein CRH09_15320 [Nocardia terpenica]